MQPDRGPVNSTQTDGRQSRGHWTGTRSARALDMVEGCGRASPRRASISRCGQQCLVSQFLSCQLTHSEGPRGSVHMAGTGRVGCQHCGSSVAVN